MGSAATPARKSLLSPGNGGRRSTRTCDVTDVNPTLQPAELHALGRHVKANGRMCPGHPTSRVDQGLLARSEATSDQ